MPTAIDNVTPALSMTSMVKLVSDDGQEYSVARELVEQSRVLAAFLDPRLGFAESQTGIIRLKDIPGPALKRVVEYLIHKKACEGLSEPPLFDVKAEESLELLLVADYLDI